MSEENVKELGIMPDLAVIVTTGENLGRIGKLVKREAALVGNGQEGDRKIVDYTHRDTVAFADGSTTVFENSHLVPYTVDEGTRGFHADHYDGAGPANLLRGATIGGFYDSFEGITNDLYALFKIGERTVGCGGNCNCSNG